MHKGRTDARTTRTRAFLEAIKEHILSQKPMVLDFIFSKKEQMESAWHHLSLWMVSNLTTLFCYTGMRLKERRATEDYPISL